MSEYQGGGPPRETPPPVPDPTVLTTEQLERAIANLKEIIETRVKGAEDVSDEKFNSVTEKFGLVERQRVEQKMDTKAAVDAALAAAKEAVKEQTTASGLSITKSETATAEQLKQLSATFTTANSGLSAQVIDLKTRVERIENVKQGANENRTESQANVSSTVLIVGAIVAAVSLALGMYAALKPAPAAPPAQIVTVPQPTTP